MPFDTSMLLRIAWRASPGSLARHLTSRLPEGQRWLLAPHLRLLSDRLRAAAFGACPRLMVEMPPRHGKSELVSRWFPVWLLEHWAGRRVILASYEADFAATWGRKVRDTIEANADYLNCRVSGASAAADAWETTDGGGMTTAGVGGPITGKGADLLVIDDPVKNWEEAQSATIRDKVWDWWTSTALTRLEPGAAAVVLMTRWHKDDLIGRLLAQEAEGGPPWQRLRLPALAEADDPLGRPLDAALWPERYDAAALLERRRAMGRHQFSALYQQRPTDPEGEYFRRAWLLPAVPPSPAARFVRKVRAWDLAGTPAGAGASDPDWTAGVLMGETDAGLFHVLDVRRARASPGEVERLVTSTARADGTGTQVRMEQEPGSSGKALVERYAGLLRAYDFRAIRPSGDKVTRSMPFNAACERGDVRLAAGTWTDELVEELAAFPNGSHDDQVDAACLAYSTLANDAAAWDAETVRQVFRPEPPRKPDPHELLMRKLRGERDVPRRVF